MVRLGHKIKQTFIGRHVQNWITCLIIVSITYILLTALEVDRHDVMTKAQTEKNKDEETGLADSLQGFSNTLTLGDVEIDASHDRYTHTVGRPTEIPEIPQVNILQKHENEKGDHDLLLDKPESDLDGYLNVVSDGATGNVGPNSNITNSVLLSSTLSNVAAQAIIKLDFEQQQKEDVTDALIDVHAIIHELEKQHEEARHNEQVSLREDIDASQSQNASMKMLHTVVQIITPSVDLAQQDQALMGQGDLLIDMAEREKSEQFERLVGQDTKNTKQINTLVVSSSSSTVNDQAQIRLKHKLKNTDALPVDAFVVVKKKDSDLEIGTNFLGGDIPLKKTVAVNTPRIFHLLGTRLAMGVGKYPTRMNMTLDLFETFTLPNVVRQEGPFQWVLFTDPKMLDAYRHRLNRIIKPYSFIHVAQTLQCPYGMSPMFQPPDYAGVPSLSNMVVNVSRDYDVVITTRVDADDIMHPDAFKITRLLVNSRFDSILNRSSNVKKNHTVLDQSPVFAVTFKGGYTWHPVANSDYGRLAPLTAPTHAIGMSIVAPASMDVRECNAYGFHHKEVLDYTRMQCIKHIRRIIETSVQSSNLTHTVHIATNMTCHDNATLHIVLPAPGWIYVRTLLSDAKANMKFKKRRKGNIKAKDTARVLKRFHINPQAVKELIRRLPTLYNNLLNENVSGKACGFQRNHVELSNNNN